MKCIVFIVLDISTSHFSPAPNSNFRQDLVLWPREKHGGAINAGANILSPSYLLTYRVQTDNPYWLETKPGKPFQHTSLYYLIDGKIL